MIHYHGDLLVLLDWFVISKIFCRYRFPLILPSFYTQKVNRNEEKAWNKQRCLEKTERRSPKNICNTHVVSDYVEPK